MRKGLAVALALVVVAAVLATGCASGTSAGSDKGLLAGDSPAVSYSLAGDSLQQTGVWVTGMGKVSAVPDVAIINLGVEAQEATVSEAQSKAASAMSDVIAVLVANGVAEKDVQTQWFSISAVTRWDDDWNRSVTVGYRVTNTVTAKIRQIDDTGAIIDAVAKAGGDLTRVSGIGFAVDDPEPYYDQAREEAILDAMAKAEQIASVADVSLGAPTYIGETGSSAPPIPYPVRAYQDSGGEAFDVTTPISVGETEIVVTVQMGFGL